MKCPPNDYDCGDLFASQQIPFYPSLNLDFEEKGSSPNKPKGWYVGGEGYKVALDTATVQSGKQSLRIQYQKQGIFGVATQQVPAAVALGKQLCYSGYIKTDGVSTGYAGLWCRVDGPNGILAFDNMSVRGPKGEIVDDRAVRGTTEWTGYHIKLEVTPSATSITFGAFLAGDGIAWFDTLMLSIDGQPYEQVLQEYREMLKPTEKQLAWLRMNVIPFATLEPSHGFDDLQPLKEIVGQARIVALGEATHGTSEFFKMKHRLTEFLASEMGFTLFAIEANMPEAYRVNDYVLTGDGEPEELLKGMYFWMWNTLEVLDLIKWMRKFNQSGKGSMQFLAFDMQFPGGAMTNVRRFVEKVDQDYLEALDKAYAPLNSWHQTLVEMKGKREKREAMLKIYLEQKEELYKRTRNVLMYLEGSRNRYLKKQAVTDVDWAIQNARVVSQAAQQFKEISGSSSYRELCMAENVDWLLKHAPDCSKIVLWAHNAHVMKRVGTMGAHLAKRYGSDLLVLGFTLHQGRYNALHSESEKLTDHEAIPSYVGTVERYFHETGLSHFILDLRKASKQSPSSSWLTKPLEMRSIGALATDMQFYSGIVSELYDGLIFFDKTTVTALLR